MSPDSKETVLGSSDQLTFLSAGKNTRVVLKPCCAWKCVPATVFAGVNISEVPGSFVTTDEFSVRVTKITSRTGVP